MAEIALEAETLDDWITLIESRHPGWDLGLERVTEVGKRLDVLKPAPQVILVAGTNGKGSTCEYLTGLSMKAGLTVGTSTSPHFRRFNERIRVNGVEVDDDVIIAAFSEIEAAREEISLSYFEFSTLASLVVFKHQQVDIAVLEIGLGGRLDAMNIVDPDVSVITSISMDHESWLGNDRELIAVEKAGIMRAGIPCIHADRNPTASMFTAAEDHGAMLKLIGKAFDFEDGALNLSGKHISLKSKPKLPPESFAAACQAMSELGYTFTTEDLNDLLQHTTMTGRSQELQLHCPVILDVAHNPAAAERLAENLEGRAVQGNVVAVVGMYADKDMAGVLGALTPKIKTWHLSDLDEARGAPAADIQAVLSEISAVKSHTYAKISDAMKAAIDCCGSEDMLVVFGSFPVVAGALQFIEDQAKPQ